MNLDKWARLDKMATRAPANLSGYQWSELIEFARDQLGQDAAQAAYWQRKQSEYESSKAQEETRLAEQLEAPALEIDPVKAVREWLMADFGIENSDAATNMLVEMLIKQIPPKMFDPAKPDRYWIDRDMFDHVRNQVEVEDLNLLDAYKATDTFYDWPKGSTATRFSRLSKMELPAVGFREIAGDIDGEVVVTKEHSGKPKHPDIVAFLEQHSQRRPKLTKPDSG